MKSTFALAGAFFIATSVNAAGYAPTQASETVTDLAFAPTSAPASLDALLNPSAQAKSDTSPLRLQMISDAGRTVGFRGGMAARAAEIRSALEKRTEELSQLFNFAPLVSASGTLPPVIVEAQDVASFTPDQYRMASKVYKIARPERFVSTPPTWRDYLYTGLPTQAAVDLPIAAAQPKTGDERDAWQKAVTAGWAAGVENCNAIMRANFARMTRDYTGMVTYSTLLQQGMVSQTRVAETQQTVTGHANELMIGDTTRRLTGPAQFQADANKWAPRVSYATGIQAKPAGTYPVAPPAPSLPAAPAAQTSPAPSPAAAPSLAPAGGPAVQNIGGTPKPASTSLAIPVPSAPGKTTPAPATPEDSTVGAAPRSGAYSARAPGPPSPPPPPPAPAESRTGNVTSDTKTDVPQAPASPPPAEPPPTTSPEATPVARAWAAKQGMTLRDVITEWGRSASPPWHVAWQTNLNYAIAADFSVTAEDFLHAVAKTFGAYGRAKRQFRLSQQPDQHVLVVEEEKP